MSKAINRFVASHAKTLRQEMAVSLIFNAIVIPALLWMIGVPAPQTLFGPNSIFAALIPGAAAATFIMTIVATTIIRVRKANGSLADLDWPRTERGRYRFVPTNLLLRAIALAAVAVLILAPTSFIVIAASNLLPFTSLEASVFNVLYGVAVALLMTRSVVLSALADPIKRVPSRERP